MIKVEHLRKEYSGVTPLKDVNITINDGDVISIIGPSGTGKSTFIRCLNLLEKPTSGHIYLDDKDITDPQCDISSVRKKMGMVFQSFNLFGHLTVIENLMKPQMDLLGTSKQKAYDEGMRLLRMVGLGEKKLNYPDELSGGQKQRIAIARTLSMDPDIILFDEPTSALDPTMVGEVQAVIRDLAKTGKTILIVTHEMSFAKAISNRVLYMDEGGIYEEGTPKQIFDNPVKEKTRRFINHLTVLEFSIENRDYDFIAMMNDIAEYGLRNQIPQSLTGKIQLAFEELTQELVKTIDVPHISVTCEYSQKSESAAMVFKYSGSYYDIINEGDDIAMDIVKGIAAEITVDRTKEKLPNSIKLVLNTK